MPSPSIPEERPWFIYTLIDPRTGAVKYVGSTKRLGCRQNEHLSRGRSAKSDSAVARWAKTLLGEGVKPLMRVIETGTGDYDSAEQKWIAHYREAGAELANRSIGGKLAALGAPRPDMAGPKPHLSEMRRGKKLNITEEDRERKRHAGRTQGIKNLRSISAYINSFTPEQRSERMRLINVKRKASGGYQKRGKYKNSDNNQ